MTCKISLTHQTNYNGWIVSIDGKVLDYTPDSLEHELAEWSYQHCNRHGESDVSDVDEDDIFAIVHAMYGNDVEIELAFDSLSS